MDRTTAALVASLIVAAGCTQGPKYEGKVGMADQPGASAAPVPMDQPAPTMTLQNQAMQNVMQAKLTHTHALLEGIALADFLQIEQNAEALTWLSQQSEFQVHETVAYVVFSDQFREITSNMADHARQQDLEAVSVDYIQMTSKCMDCHAYLRREGLVKELPGAVSWAGGR